MNANPNAKPCPVSETDLLAFRDRELPPARQQQLAAHVETCPECQVRLAQARHLASTLTSATPPRDNPVARAAIHDRIAADRAAWWRHRALAAALPVALLVIVLVSFNRFQADDCESCPPLTPPLQITAITGMPAGWGNARACQPANAGQTRLPANQSANAATSRYVANRPLANASVANRNAGAAPAAPPLARSPRSGANWQPNLNPVPANAAQAGSSAPVAGPCGPGQPEGAAFLSEAGMVRGDQPGS